MSFKQTLLDELKTIKGLKIEETPKRIELTYQAGGINAYFGLVDVNNDFGHSYFLDDALMGYHMVHNYDETMTPAQYSTIIDNLVSELGMPFEMVVDATGILTTPVPIAPYVTSSLTALVEIENLLATRYGGD